MFDAHQSAELRQKLVIDVANIASPQHAATWAREALITKNRLLESDAKLVEAAFERRMSEFPRAGETIDSNEDSSVASSSAEGRASVGVDSAPVASGVDKSVLAIATPRRYRNRQHLRYVMQLPCLVCGRKPSDPHHLRYLQPRALGRKASDEFAVPLCRVHHRAAHRAGDERAWWQAAGIDPVKIAGTLWKHTRVEEGQMPPDATRQTAETGVACKSESIGGAGPDLG
jgi:hypothetical protein